MCERRAIHSSGAPAVKNRTMRPGFVSLWRACWTLSFAAGLFLTGCSTKPEINPEVMTGGAMSAKKDRQPEAMKATVQNSPAPAAPTVKPAPPANPGPPDPASPPTAAFGSAC